jgi:hypothetical protein
MSPALLSSSRLDVVPVEEVGSDLLNLAYWSLSFRRHQRTSP